MSRRWLMGVAAIGMGASLLSAGCDSSSDNNDNNTDGGTTNTVHVDGAYTGTRSNTNGSANIAFHFNQSGDVLSGSFSDSGLGSGVISGTITGDDLEFTTVMSSGDVIIDWEGQATSSGSEMSGTWNVISGGSASGNWTAMR